MKSLGATMADTSSLMKSITSIAHLLDLTIDYILFGGADSSIRDLLYLKISNLLLQLHKLRHRLDDATAEDRLFLVVRESHLDEVLEQFHSALEQPVSNIGGSHDAEASRSSTELKQAFEKHEVVSLLEMIEWLEPLLMLA